MKQQGDRSEKMPNLPIYPYHRINDDDAECLVKCDIRERLLAEGWSFMDNVGKYKASLPFLPNSTRKIEFSLSYKSQAISKQLQIQTGDGSDLIPEVAYVNSKHAYIRQSQPIISTATEGEWTIHQMSITLDSASASGLDSLIIVALVFRTFPSHPAFMARLWERHIPFFNRGGGMIWPILSWDGGSDRPLFKWNPPADPSDLESHYTRYPVLVNTKHPILSDADRQSPTFVSFFSRSLSDFVARQMLAVATDHMDSLTSLGSMVDDSIGEKIQSFFSGTIGNLRVFEKLNNEPSEADIVRLSNEISDRIWSQEWK